MKIRLVYIFSLFLFFSCKQTSNLKKEACEKSNQFGDVSICLPQIDGMIECYSNPIVKSKINYNESGEKLAVYLNNEIYEHLDKINELKFDDYFTVYVVDKLKGVSADNSFLNQISNAFENNLLKENWNSLKSKIENNINHISIGRPVLLESYSQSNDIRSFVFLNKIRTNTEEYISVMIMNLILLKKRVIWAAYYKDYKNKESIQSTKSKNDYMTLLLLEENK